MVAIFVYSPVCECVTVRACVFLLGVFLYIIVCVSTQLLRFPPRCLQGLCHSEYLYFYSSLSGMTAAHRQGALWELEADAH